MPIRAAFPTPFPLVAAISKPGKGLVHGTPGCISRVLLSTSLYARSWH